MRTVRTLVCAVLALGSLQFFGQPAARADHEPSAQVQEMAAKVSKELNLTDAQKAKVKQIADASRKKLKAIHDDTTLTTDQKKAKAQDVLKVTRAAMRAQLTPDQQKKFDAMVVEAKKKHSSSQGKM